jgi:2-succinyl-6-hydroxy-2,4-cyclohexadiene-1-carboxylate synthase
MRYMSDRAGPGQERLVLLHGFTQTSASWGPVVDELQGRFELVLPDAPGHGGSSGVRADLWRTAGLLADAVPLGATWVGYSMGGRMALHVALARPERVRRLVLISTSAGIEGASQRASRREADEELARRIEREGTERFLEWWLAQPLFASLPREGAGLPDRLANTPAGLASSLRWAGAGAQEPLWDRLGELGQRRLPVLLIAGGLDHAYRAHAGRMAALIGPTASVHVVNGAGHACHLERPLEVAAAITSFCPPAPAARTGPASESQADGEQHA